MGSTFLEMSLRFEDNGKGHNDMALRWNGRIWTCDSYYLRLDPGVLQGDESNQKVRLVLRRLVEQWLVALKQLQDGGTAFLPYDFSDQCTGWLQCQRSGDSVTISRGWATVEGWSFCPSDIGEFINHVPGFQIDGPTESTGLDELNQAINRSLAEVD